MNKWKNAGLIILALLAVGAAVGGMFLLRQPFRQKADPKPDPVEVQTETESEEPEPESSDEPLPQTPAAVPTENPEGKKLEEKVERVLAGLSLEEKIGQMFLVDFSQLGGSSSTSVNERIKSRLSSYPVGGVVFRPENVVSKDQVTSFIRELQENAPVPMFIAVQEEGGSGSVLGSREDLELPQLYDASDYGESKDAKRAQTDAGNMARALKELGFNMNLAPVADVVLDPEKSILGKRAFGSDAMTVRQMAEGQILGIQQEGVSSVMKYFPGQGGIAQSTQDGYGETDRSKEEMRAREWLPYLAGISAGVDGIMMSNISAPALTDGERTPSALSSKVVSRILREELGYYGMVISAPLSEQAVTRYYSSSEAVFKAIDAGVDVMLMPGSLDGTYAAVESAVKNGGISMDRIDLSVKRILAVKVVRGIIDPEDYPPLPAPSAEPSEEGDSSREEDSGEDSREDSGEDSVEDSGEDPEENSEEDSGEETASRDSAEQDAESEQ